MDVNKAKKMEEIGFCIQPACSICKHCRFCATSVFGECTKHSYEHEKHKRTHGMTIYRSGRCNDFEINDESKAMMGDYIRFYKEKDNEETTNGIMWACSPNSLTIYGDSRKQKKCGCPENYFCQKCIGEVSEEGAKFT